MSTPSDPQDFPQPSTAARTLLQRGKNLKKSLLDAWRPRGTTMEPGVATLSRGALRLIDRSTGDAHSADELGLGSRDKSFPIPLATLRVAAAWKDALPDAPAGNGGALGLGDTAGAVVVPVLG